jgi:PhnB protein
MAAKPIPDGFHTVTPYLLVPNVPRLLDYLIKAFDAKVLHRMDRADGSTAHAQVRIGDSAVMMGEPMGEMPPMPASIYLYVTDCDAVYQRAMKAGAESYMPPMTMHFSGQRYGGVKDPAGNLWWIATNVEDVSPEESKRRFEAWQRERIRTAGQ